MSDIISGRDINLDDAKRLAKEIAALLGSEPKPNRKMVMGKPYSPYQIPIHTDEFYCFVKVSDRSYGFKAERRPKKGFVGDFFVSLKEPSGFMFATKFVPEAYTTLGVRVYRQPFATDEEIVQKAVSPN